MDLPSLLPKLGTPVPTDVLNLDKVPGASQGELLHAGLQLIMMATNQMAKPASFHDIPTYRSSSGGDWAGFQPSQQVAPEEANQVGAQAGVQDGEPPAAVETSSEELVVPEQYYDTIQALGLMLSQLDNLTEAANTIFAGYARKAMRQQALYLGTPAGAVPFRDEGQYLRQTRLWSAPKAKKHVERVPLLTNTPDGDPGNLFCQPTYPDIAASFVEGRISGEIADRIVGMHHKLAEYSQEVGEPIGYMEQVLQAFQPTLVAAGETSTPEAFTSARKMWMDQLAHAINADGPSPSQSLRKPPDNAIKTKSLPGGGGRIWMDATPELFHQFKNFSLHMLKASGGEVFIPQDLINLIRPANETNGPPPSDEDGGPLPENLDDLPNFDDPDRVMGEDDQGNPYTAQELDEIDPLTSGQKIGALLIGMFRTLLRMDPAEVGIKRSHGASAQLVIVQDVQTAYQTLGVPPLPPDAQRPTGIEGFVPPLIRHPNTPGRPEPEGNDSGSSTADNSGIRNVKSRLWTPFRSEAKHTGPIHPADAEILCCDSELVGQIWEGQDTVLNQKRTQRLFTLTQRRAILARDRGCQIPGCTTPAILCDVHHIKEWLGGGSTDEENATTICGTHHTAIHTGAWTIHRIDGLLFFKPAPWLDPCQPLLRNLYWNN